MHKRQIKFSRVHYTGDSMLHFLEEEKYPNWFCFIVSKSNMRKIIFLRAYEQDYLWKGRSPRGRAQKCEFLNQRKEAWLKHSPAVCSGDLFCPRQFFFFFAYVVDISRCQWPTQLGREPRQSRPFPDLPTAYRTYLWRTALSPNNNSKSKRTNVHK